MGAIDWVIEVVTDNQLGLTSKIKIVISYIIGFVMTRTPYYWIQTVGCCKYLLIFLFQLVGIPLFSFIEGISVLFWFFSMIFVKDTGFEIVDKEKTNDTQYLENLEQNVVENVEVEV
jgi:hypothetical protein